ncbi:phage portal protein [Streptococcus sp. ZJ151]|uniref:phage portal protein n=1 Tax=Streptococcus jiangjianxini TaxID=3161189 RepID=UPI0032EB8D24
MDKVNEFEHGIDSVTDTRNDSLVFHKLANEHFRYSNTDELLNTDKGRKSLREMISAFFDYQNPRLSVLASYAQGDNYSILTGNRRLDKEKSDYRVRHKWGGYISSFATSYVIGNPVSVGVLEGANQEQLQTIKEIEWHNDINALNADLAFDASVYGRAYEYHFRDKQNIDRVVLINPLEMFVIRDLTVEQHIIAAVHLPVYEDKVHMTLYTADSVVAFKPFSQHAPRLVKEQLKKHKYHDIPVVEWWNNRFRIGDYESEISLIDAYDAGQSDTANYMSDLNDAMLLIKGDLEALGLDAESTAKMKEANTLLLKTGIGIDGKQTTADAEYIYKQYDVGGTEAYKNRLANDIHRFSRIPNLDDDRFNSTSSGIALLYKMIGLEQVRKDKETYFTKALRRRYELISNIHKAISAPKIEANKLTFTFHPNIPQDIWTEIKAYVEAGGEVSQETLMENASFTDYQTEQSRILKQGGYSDVEVNQIVGEQDDEQDNNKQSEV